MIKTKEMFDQINQYSRQLLSRILVMHNSYQSLPQDLESTKAQFSVEDNKGVFELIKKRQSLISKLFERSTTEEINAESDLLQNMLELDEQLSANSAIYKQAIADQVIKIKKSKKASKSYQKY